MKSNNPTWKAAALESLLADIGIELERAMDATASLHGPQRMAIFSRCMLASALVKASQGVLAKPD